MNDKRREILLGYLLGALEPHEHQKVKAELDFNESLQQDLANLYQEISPINMIADHYEAPKGLAKRTCRNIWDKIESKTSHEPSAIEKAFTVTPSSPKRRATVVFTHNDTANPSSVDNAIDIASSHVSQGPHFDTVSAGTSPLPIVDETPELMPSVAEAPIPLSQALLQAPGASPKKTLPLRQRVDEVSSPRPQMPLVFADSERSIPKKHQPKYYGKKTKKEPHRRPWTVRDVFASLLVGLTVAVLVFPVIQMGMGNFRDMVVQKKIQTVARNVPANTSQYSSYGLTANDLQWLAGVNIDTHSTTTRQNHVDFPAIMMPRNGSDELFSLAVPVSRAVSSLTKEVPLTEQNALQSTSYPTSLAILGHHVAIASSQADGVFNRQAKFSRVCSDHTNADVVQTLLIQKLFRPVRPDITSLPSNLSDKNIFRDSSRGPTSAELSLFP